MGYQLIGTVLFIFYIFNNNSLLFNKTNVFIFLIPCDINLILFNIDLIGFDLYFILSYQIYFYHYDIYCIFVNVLNK